MMKIKNNRNKSAGITLIALVVTIIVLLILAGISIQMLTGDNGILIRVGEAKERTNEESTKEQIQLEVLGSLEKDGTLLISTLNSNIKNHINDVSTDDATEFPLTVTYTITGNMYEIDENGKVYDRGLSITNYVKIGDYINYDPTWSDAKKTTKVDASKLTYTSPVGTATQHGNGYTSSETGQGQKFTAKSSEESGIKWRVLSVNDNRVEIISDKVIKKDTTNQNSGNYTLKGARAYLYVEQELNEICKIYGYGYGADKSVVSTFKVGGPYPGEEIIKTITQTGARSISLEDIDSLAGIYKDETDGKMKYSDGTVITNNYGKTTNPTSNIKYPTINPSLGNTTTGISKSAGVKNLKNTNYTYDKSKIIDINIQTILFNGNYWLASRCIYSSNSTTTYFSGKIVEGNNIKHRDFCYGNSSYIYEFDPLSYGVRPIIILNPKVIDTTNANENSGKDGYAWNLK